MTIQKLKLLTLVCPIVSVLLGAGLVRYQYWHLDRLTQELATSKRTAAALEARLEAESKAHPDRAKMVLETPVPADPHAH